MATAAHIEFMINNGSCPYFYKNISTFIDTNFGYGTATVSANVEAGTMYYIFVHNSGSNFSLVGCDGPCDEYCPNDCTDYNGVCDLTTHQCTCRTGWIGKDCSLSSANQTTPTHHKEPFGSWPLFYAVVAGLPAFVVIALVFLIVSYLTVKKQREAQKRVRRIGKKLDGEENEALLSPGLGSSPSPPIRLAATVPPLS
eukprot:Phypoly_transcript_15087.p1 GENE.Phypoly_transcript_15087~~Phypoly_transcript_15087.p1  ORF type:complete len:198 (+),score=30.78 Phypoly_transcript_15087:301-894(+)